MKTTKKQPPKYNWIDKRTGLLKKTAKFSIHNAKSGGLGLFAIRLLKEAGIPARQCATPYMEHVGIEVPAKFERRAEKLVL